MSNQHISSTLIVSTTIAILTVMVYYDKELSHILAFMLGVLFAAVISDSFAFDIIKSETLWLNMGYWEDENATFERACQHLLEHVIESLNLKEASTLIDFGYGCGDQDAYISSLYPQLSITGVTLESVHSQIAKARFGHITAIRFVTGDAADPLSWKDASNRAVVIEPCMYDVALALDSAYHFRNREGWLKVTYRQLKKGGRLAVGDVILGDGASKGGIWTRIIVSAFCLLAGVPSENLASLETYRKHWEHSGYLHVEIQDISSRVFPGLSRFIKRHRQSMKDVVNDNRRWRRYTGVSELLDFIHERRILSSNRGMRETKPSAPGISAATDLLKSGAASRSTATRPLTSTKPATSASVEKSSNFPGCSYQNPVREASGDHNASRKHAPAMASSTKPHTSRQHLAEKAHELVQTAEVISASLREIQGNLNEPDDQLVSTDTRNMDIKIGTPELPVPLLIPVSTQILGKNNNGDRDQQRSIITHQAQASRPTSPARSNLSAIFGTSPKRDPPEPILPLSTPISPSRHNVAPLDQDLEMAKRQLNFLARESRQLRLQCEEHPKRFVGDDVRPSGGIVSDLVNRVKALEGESRRAKARNIHIPKPNPSATSTRIATVAGKIDAENRSDGFLKARVAQLESDCSALRDQLAQSVASTASAARQAQEVSANVIQTNAVIEANAYDMLQHSYHDLSIKCSRQAKEMAAMTEQNEILRKENRRLVDIERELTNKIVNNAMGIGRDGSQGSKGDYSVLLTAVDTEMTRIKSITANMPSADPSFPLSDPSIPVLALLTPLATVRRLATSTPSPQAPVIVLSDIVSAISTAITASVSLIEEGKNIGDRIRRIKAESSILQQETDLTLRAIEDERRMHVARLSAELERAKSEIAKLQRIIAREEEDDDSDLLNLYDDAIKQSKITKLKQEIEEYKADNTRLKQALVLAEASNGGVESEAVLAVKRARDDAESRVEDERLKNKKAAELIRTLKDEVGRLRMSGGGGAGVRASGPSTAEMNALLRENEETLAKLDQLNQVIEEHMEQARILKEENSCLRDQLKRSRDKQKLFGRLEKEAKELETNQVELITALQDYERQYQAIIGLCSVTDPSILVETTRAPGSPNGLNIVSPHPRPFHPKFARLHQQYASAAHSLERAQNRMGELGKEAELHGTRMAELARELAVRGDEVVRSRDEARKAKEEVTSERDKRTRLESKLRRIANGVQPLLTQLTGAPSIRAT
ncbi:hypothetical protein SeMB42_g00801 [Synchytrium endobioticum]|uniref:Methyltransferase domain-containing protein n=1 Tax=Synchytrium endobioticum TaxID=286115 RepID=A0A507DRD4_9FUNG|nr:hypothetical protein SeMB42_g00801 [Synchytrium endobioticum]